MINVLQKITEHRTARHWTEYKLAEMSGLPQSTISSWYRKNMLPSLASLEKICNAFQITLSQFFAEEDCSVELSEEEQSLLNTWHMMDQSQREAFLRFLKTLT